MIKQLSVQGKKIQIVKVGSEQYISLTDMCADFGESSEMIANWLRRRDTIDFIGLWEQIHNPNFKSLDFEGIKNESGYNRFSLSPKKWIETVNAKCYIKVTTR